MTIQTARAARRVTAAPRVRETRWGRGDCQLGPELPVEQAQDDAARYRALLVAKGLTKTYGVRVEKLGHGMARVLVGFHDDRRSMPRKWA